MYNLIPLFLLLLWIIHIIPVLCLLFFRARLFIDALWSPSGNGLTSLLSFVMYNCEFATFPLGSLVRCGTFLIFVHFLKIFRNFNIVGPL